MNKYQEALNEIKNGGSFQGLEVAIDTLQELVTKYGADTEESVITKPNFNGTPERTIIVKKGGVYIANCKL